MALALGRYWTNFISRGSPSRPKPEERRWPEWSAFRSKDGQAASIGGWQGRQHGSLVELRSDGGGKRGGEVSEAGGQVHEAPPSTRHEERFLEFGVDGQGHVRAGGYGGGRCDAWKEYMSRGEVQHARYMEFGYLC